MSADAYLTLAGVLFSIGLAGGMLRRNSIVAFMSIELMLNAANLVFVTAARYWGNIDGQIAAFIVHLPHPKLSV